MYLKQRRVKPERLVSGFFVIIGISCLIALGQEWGAAPYLTGSSALPEYQAILPLDEGMTRFPTAMMNSTLRNIASYHLDTLYHNLISLSSYYDLLYHKRSGDEGIDICSKNLQTDILLKRGKHLFVNGLDYSGHNLDFPEPDLSLDIKSELNAVRVYSGYKTTIGLLSMGILAASDLIALEQLAKYDHGNRAAYTYSTSVLDVQGYIALLKNKVALSYMFDNNSLLSGNVVIKSQKNGNTRDIVIDINQNRSQFDAGYVSKWFDCTINTHIETYSSKPIVTSSQLSLDTKGWGGGGASFFNLKALPYSPKVNISLGIKKINLSGMERVKNQFAHLDSTIFIDARIAADMNISKQNTIGLFFENNETRHGNGLLEVYPFTSWTLLFDVPEKIKLSFVNTQILTTGIKGKSDITIKGARWCSLHYGFAYCDINLGYHTEELVLVAGVFPDYRNEKVYSMERDFILLSLGIEQRLTLRMCETIIRLRQTVPFELKSSSRHVQTNSENRASKKTRIFGGFRCDVGFNFKW